LREALGKSSAAVATAGRGHLGTAGRLSALSQRRASRAPTAVRSSVEYIAIRPPELALRTRIHEIAEVRV